MSFNIGLSGIRAAASELNITGNNIANAGTVGFKLSRAEFSDVYAASVLGSGSNAQGSGVLMGDVSQLFTQGNINFTENSLDLAVNGNGFFVTSNNGALSYTRAGYFGTDRQGNLVNNFGEKLQGFGVNAVTGQINQGVQTDLRVDTRSANPRASSKIESTLNLNSTSVRLPNAEARYQAERGRYVDDLELTPEENAAAADMAARQGTLDRMDSSTYNSSTSVNVYDSQGNPHVLTKYFVKTEGNAWDLHAYIGDQRVSFENADGTAAPVARLTFNETGQLVGGAQLTLAGWYPKDQNGEPTGAEGSSPTGAGTGFELDLTGSTQYASSFAVTSVVQDGFTTGELAGLEIDDTGLLVARYTNGQTRTQGQVVLATFANPQGLTPQGKTSWTQSFASGEPVVGSPTTGTLGTIQSGALEQSNVDLSEQLINLIVAQRNYQANAKTIQTEDAVTQTIINLR